MSEIYEKVRENIYNASVPIGVRVRLSRMVNIIANLEHDMNDLAEWSVKNENAQVYEAATLVARAISLLHTIENDQETT